MAGQVFLQNGINLLQVSGHFNHHQVYGGEQHQLGMKGWTGHG